MIETVLNPHNLQRAVKQVRKNKGSAGVDGMAADKLYDHFKQNKEAIEQSIRSERYCPQPILGVEPSGASSRAPIK